MRKQGDSITDSDEPHGQEIIQAGGFPVLTAKVEHELANSRSEQKTNRKRSSYGPHYVDADPPQAERTDVVQTKQT